MLEKVLRKVKSGFPTSVPLMVFARIKKGATVTIRNLTGFAEACQEALNAVLDAIATVGEERWRLLTDAKQAADKALHDAHSGEEWYFADHLRQAIKQVQVSSRDAA